MQDFIFELSDGKKIVRNIAAENVDEALSLAFKALSAISSSVFPPPELIEITVSDATSKRIATMRLIYEIDMASMVRTCAHPYRNSPKAISPRPYQNYLSR